MVDCCNSDQVQSSYFAMTSAFKDFIFAAHEVFYNISQVISDLDFKEFKVCHRNRRYRGGTTLFLLSEPF